MGPPFAPRRSGRTSSCLWLALILTLAHALPARAQEGKWAKFVKASLVFRDDFDATRHYPHLLRVFLRLDNLHDADLSWAANPVEGVEAELLGADGKPVPHPPTVSGVQSGLATYSLPYGSRLDWLITHGGVSMVGNLADSYALVVGGRGWLVPVRTADAYRLHVRLRGLPGKHAATLPDLRAAGLLLDLAPARVEVTP